LGQHTEKHVDYILRRIQLLLRHEIKPYFVFDGDRLPTKSTVEDLRDASRLQAKRLAMEYLRQGKLKLADEQFMKCVDVTPVMAYMVIAMLKRLKVPFVVAPYEADAQLVYLEKRGEVDGILSEDSDLIVFGAQTLITKLDVEGNCIEIERQNFKDVKQFAMADFKDEHLRIMAILSGCDYSPGLPKIGLVKAHRLVRQHRDMERILRAIRLDNITVIPPDFESVYHQARLTFLHQRVFCPDLQQLVMLNEPRETITFPGFDSFIGPVISPELSREIAIGNIDPISKKPFDPVSAPMAIRTVSAPGRIDKGIERSAIAPGTKLITSFFSPVSARRKPLQPLHNHTTAPSIFSKRTNIETKDSIVASSPAFKRARQFIDSGSSDELEDPITRSPFFQANRVVKKPAINSQSHASEKLLNENKENDELSSGDDIPPIRPAYSAKIGSLFKQSTKGTVEYRPNANDSATFGTKLNDFVYTSRPL
jgi:exonuclease 1